jgi:hypothetical protein
MTRGEREEREEGVAWQAGHCENRSMQEACWTSQSINNGTAC